MLKVAHRRPCLLSLFTRNNAGIGMHLQAAGCNECIGTVVCFVVSLLEGTIRFITSIKMVSYVALRDDLVATLDIRPVHPLSTAKNCC
jgi:hypothetical protein